MRKQNNGSMIKELTLTMQASLLDKLRNSIKYKKSKRMRQFSGRVSNIRNLKVQTCKNISMQINKEPLILQ